MWSRRQYRILDQRPFLLLIATLIGLAWLTLFLWGESPYARFLNHDALDQVSPIFLPIFVVAWDVMIAAMMLPTSMPLVTTFRRMVDSQPERGRLVAELILGYLAAWTAFGIGIHALDYGLHRAVDSSAALQGGAWAIGVGTLLIAGGYQFTRLKYLCLDKCRSPLSFVVEHWRGGSKRSQAFRLGVDHGVFCLGCCWSLMLVMFALGMGNLGWMLVLGAVMAGEKNVAWGRKLSTPLGVMLIAWAVALAMGFGPALG